MTNVAAAALIIGVIIPFLISIIKQAKLPRWGNLIVTIAICTGAGLLTMYAAGQLSWASWSGPNVLVTIGLIFAASQGIYAAFWRESPAEAVINEKTSF